MCSLCSHCLIFVYSELSGPQTQVRLPWCGVSRLKREICKLLTAPGVCRHHSPGLDIISIVTREGQLTANNSWDYNGETSSVAVILRHKGGDNYRYLGLNSWRFMVFLFFKMITVG